MKLLELDVCCCTKSRGVINTSKKIANVVLELYIPDIVDIIEIVVKKSTVRGRARKVCFVFGNSKIFAKNCIACRKGNNNIMDLVFNSRDDNSINNICNLFVSNVFSTSNVG